MKFSGRVLVSTPFEDNPNIPAGFPWLTFKGGRGVLLSLQGDIHNVHNLQSELEKVKQLVNRDVNKWGLKLRDVNIKIEFL